MTAVHRRLALDVLLSALGAALVLAAAVLLVDAVEPVRGSLGTAADHLAVTSPLAGALAGAWIGRWWARSRRWDGAEAAGVAPLGLLLAAGFGGLLAGAVLAAALELAPRPAPPTGSWVALPSAEAHDRDLWVGEIAGEELREVRVAWYAEGRLVQLAWAEAATRTETGWVPRGSGGWPAPPADGWIPQRWSAPPSVGSPLGTLVGGGATVWLAERALTPLHTGLLALLGIALARRSRRGAVLAVSAALTWRVLAVGVLVTAAQAGWPLLVAIATPLGALGAAAAAAAYSATR